MYNIVKASFHDCKYGIVNTENYSYLATNSIMSWELLGSHDLNSNFYPIVGGVQVYNDWCEKFGIDTICTLDTLEDYNNLINTNPELFL